MSAEQSEVQFGRTPIPFLIRRSAKRGTVALTIEKSGELVVTAPAGASIQRLNDIVRHKAPWVVESIRRAAETPKPPPEREFITGEAVHYLGRHYRLKVIEAGATRGNGDAAQRTATRIWAGWYEVVVSSGLSDSERRSEVRRRLASSLEQRASGYIPERLNHLCERAGIRPPTLFVREPRRRWASCDARGIVRINWRIVQAPITIIDYVIAHELVHLLHRSHGPAFWAELGRRMPDYEARRRRLREIGPALEW